MIDRGKIRKRRRELDISQKALGCAIGQDQSYISNIEQGRLVSITADSLWRIARALRVSMDDLMRQDDDVDEDPPLARVVHVRGESLPAGLTDGLY